MNKKIFLVLFVLVICSSFVNASSSVIDMLEQGQTKTYDLDGNSYNIEVTYINNNNVKFKINGWLTRQLSKGEIYVLHDNSAEIEVLDVLETEAGEVNSDLVEFKLTKRLFCGDGVCSEDEDCNSDECCDGEKTDLDDEDNCGRCGNECDDDEKCDNGKCLPYYPAYCGNDVCDYDETYKTCEDDCPKPKPVCGDSLCEKDETCEKDSCCNGDLTNFNTDEDNCGECGIRCSKYKKCVKGKCKNYCGNDRCDNDENCEFCPDDCGECEPEEENLTAEISKPEVQPIKNKQEERAVVYTAPEDNNVFLKLVGWLKGLFS